MKADRLKSDKVQVGEIDLGQPVDLIVLGARKREAARCRLLDADQEITLRSAGVWNLVPGEIATVRPKKHWRYADHPYLSGDIHYDIGRQIGDLSLGKDFQGLLRWGWVDNRPYLRCLHGYGLCLWRLKRFAEAAAVFSRMLWLNPSDNQGARFNLCEVQARTAWGDGSDT